MKSAWEINRQTCPRSPGTHTVGPWVVDSTNLYRDLRTGTQYIGNWASRDGMLQAAAPNRLTFQLRLAPACSGQREMAKYGKIKLLLHQHSSWVGAEPQVTLTQTLEPAQNTTFVGGTAA